MNLVQNWLEARGKQIVLRVIVKLEFYLLSIYQRDGYVANDSAFQYCIFYWQVLDKYLEF